MNASEIMNDLRRQSWTQKGEITMPFEFDPESLADQLWAEQGFYDSKGKELLVSMRRMPEYHEEFFEFEWVEILDGSVRYWKMKGVDCIHVDPAHYEMMLEKRAEGKIDHPMMFTDGRYHYRNGVEEDPDVECCLRFFYQDRDGGGEAWRSSNFDYLISVEMWGKMKKAASVFFPYSEDEEEAPGNLYTSLSFKIFEGDSDHCFLVKEHDDCEGCLEICYQTYCAKTNTYIVKDNLGGVFSKTGWAEFAALVDSFMEKHF